jgi:aromatic ring-opening dioxygenase catalytic subunit (LigB family)
MLTYTLRSGLVVLAKLYHGEPSPMTFANRTQADKAARKVGGTVHHIGRPFFVAVPTPEA